MSCEAKAKASGARIALVNSPTGSQRSGFSHPRRSPFARVASLESSLYMRNQLLRDTDWASMAHSLEVRVPLADSRLLAALAPFGGDFGPGPAKHILAGSPSRALPASVTSRAKTGFTIPVATWMRTAMEARGGAPGAPAARRGPGARDWSRVVASTKAAA